MNGPDRAAQQLAWVKAAQAGDRVAAGKAITSLDGLIWQHIGREAKAHSLRGVFFSDEDRDDMHADVQIVLLRSAIRRFDPSLGFAWSTYALYWIRWAIKHWIRVRSRTIKAPVRLQERREIVDRGTQEGAQFVALVLGGHALASLDAPVGNEGFTLSETVADVSSDVEEAIARESDRKRLREAIAKLPERERRVIELLLDGLKMAEIGEAIRVKGKGGKKRSSRKGLSRQRVMQIQLRALERLRKALVERVA